MRPVLLSVTIVNCRIFEKKLWYFRNNRVDCQGIPHLSDYPNVNLKGKNYRF